MFADFYRHHYIQTRSQAHSAVTPMDTWGLFSRVRTAFPNINTNIAEQKKFPTLLSEHERECISPSYKLL
jgi:hypothetical protein